MSACPRSEAEQASSWTFVFDQVSCTGCFACAVACKDRAGLPDSVDWLWVRPEEGGIFPAPTLEFSVVHCFHCADAPCAEVCPVDAIVRETDGRVVIREGCIRCGRCIEACPFDAIDQLADGTPQKCDGCADELAKGRDPVCVRACPMRALDWQARPIDAVAGRRVTALPQANARPRWIVLRRRP